MVLAQPREPLITVIVAVRNAERTLQRCIDSVSMQTYANKELIIFDAASSDSTVKILQLNNDKIAYWRSEPDRGVYHAWNKALDHADGEWVCFLGADDVFSDEDVLVRLVPYLVGAYPRSRVVYGRVNLVNQQGDVVDTIGTTWHAARKAFFQGTNIPHPGVMHHRSIFQDHGKFDESFHIAADYELLLRELITGDPLFVDDSVTVNMERGGMSTRPEDYYVVLRALAAARRRNGVNSFSLHLAIRTYLAWIGYWVDRIMGRSVFNHLANCYRVLTGRRRVWTK